MRALTEFGRSIGHCEANDWATTIWGAGAGSGMRGMVSSVYDVDTRRLLCVS